MSWTIDATGWIRQLTSPALDGNTPLALRPVASSAISMNLSLSTAGRLGFFIDYSERTTVGEHTFYATRTHGSTGAVGCTWTAYDSADGTQLATGSLSWADTSLDVLSFTVDIASKPAGDHRIYVLLSAPTGGAVLHHGDSTVAYGIIDDDTIATSNAIFIDVGAVTDGSGTQASPYNNWYSARDAVLTTTRFIYIKGLMVPSQVETTNLAPTAKSFALLGTFEGRTSESQRLVIRNWPSFTGGIDGDAQTDCTGFSCDGGSFPNYTVSYVTFRGLTCTDLNNTDDTKCFFLRLRGGAKTVGDFTVENTSIDGVVSGTPAATAGWFVETCDNLKLWNSSFANTTYLTGGDFISSFEAYRAENVSIQKCTFHRTAGEVYQKEGLATDAVAFSLRFNYFDGAQVRFSTQGSQLLQDFSIVQNNIFDTPRNEGSNVVQFDTTATATITTKHVISNNVFYNQNNSTRANIRFNDGGASGVQIYNNIGVDTKRGWIFDTSAETPEYIDYNHYQNDSISAIIFDYKGDFNKSLSDVVTDLSFEVNSSTGNPLLSNPSTDDFTIQVGSSALTDGVDGTQQGAYLGNFYSIGAN